MGSKRLVKDNRVIDGDELREQRKITSRFRLGKFRKLAKSRLPNGEVIFIQPLNWLSQEIMEEIDEHGLQARLDKYG